ncbi:hypothetical protein B0H14DRAFT_2394496 [Mycena olivaceomarginata]|nr:hypothetical protein B0H14DRAFT_2394496 [Mycena olivaceomarginata]
MSDCSVFILAMTHWPEIQRKAREKIDRHVGRSRMPTPVGEPVQSPLFIKLIAQGAHSWRPVAPLSVPHASTEVCLNLTCKSRLMILYRMNI